MNIDNSVFLNWVADRLVMVFGESENIDHVIKLREMATAAGHAKLAFCEEKTFVTHPGESLGFDFATEYEDWVEELWGDSEPDQEARMVSIVGLGLAGEVGELLEELLCGVELFRHTAPLAEVVKKSIRNGKVVDRKKFSAEAGDILYYLVKLLHWQGLTLKDAMESNRIKIEGRYGEKEVEEVTFEIDDVCSSCFHGSPTLNCEICNGQVEYRHTVAIPPEVYEKIRKGEI